MNARYFLFQIVFIILFSTTFKALAADDSTTLPTIEVTAESQDQSTSEISGFETQPLRKTPLSIRTISKQEIEKLHLESLRDVTNIEASATDAYNAIGYWDLISVRGFSLDSRSSVTREGLPIIAETAIFLENKEKVEILKGLSSLQAGVSAPSGLVNYVVKRPRNKKLTKAGIQLEEKSTVITSLDSSGRTEENSNFGYRINLAGASLGPQVENTQGSRSLAALAIDYQLSNSSLLSAEVEWAQQSQPSQAGFSLHGDKIPDVPDSDLNLNNQSWTKPVEFRGLTGSIKWDSLLASNWELSATLGAQTLETDDRIAYASGCTAEGLRDRFCSNGTFDIYDYRSEGEKRQSQAAKITLSRQQNIDQLVNHLSFSVLALKQIERLNPRAENLAGVGSHDGKTRVPENPTATSPSTNRDASAYDFSVTDSLDWGEWTFWLGLRFSKIHRESIRSDLSRAITYDDEMRLPWLAVSKTTTLGLGYFSYGQGAESFVTPNKSGYTNRGEFLKDVKSWQTEIGLRSMQQQLDWSLAFFQINRPIVTDKIPDYKVDGEQIHQGIEGSVEQTQGLVRYDGSLMLLHAERQGSTLTPLINGKSPVNVPTYAVRTGAEYDLLPNKDLTVGGRIIHEGTRSVTTDNQIEIPSWIRLDATLSFEQKLQHSVILWHFSIENLMNNHYWKESPSKYGHVYLYPETERTLRAGLFAQF